MPSTGLRSQTASVLPTWPYERPGLSGRACLRGCRRLVRAGGPELLHDRRADDLRVGDLLVRCGEARVAAGDLSGARTAFAEAAAVARANGDAELLATAALGFGAGRGGFEVPVQDPVQVQVLEEALAALGPRPSRLRAWVLARLSIALSFLDAETRRRVLSDEAIEVARQVGEESALGQALAAHCDSIAGPDWCEVRLDESTEIVRLGQSTGDFRTFKSC